MNIYLVTRHDRHYNDGSDYESFVCVAESEEDAKMLHPEDFRMELDERGFFKDKYVPSLHAQVKHGLALDKWARKPEDVSAELIGVVTNDSYEVEQVIGAIKED